MGESELKDRPEYLVGNFGIGHWWGICENGKHLFVDLVGTANCPDHGCIK